MDKVERQRLKTLANEAIIATYGYDNRESQLAEGLEQALDELGTLDSRLRRGWTVKDALTTPLNSPRRRRRAA